MGKNNKITPSGSGDIIFEQCEAQYELTEKLRTIFTDRGYREVRTPGIEFYDVFASRADYIPPESVYKLSDWKGRMLTVRPDSTIPIARLVSTKLKGHALPIRLYYAQRVYRQSEALRGQSAEMMQMGVERIGDATFESDTEILAMAMEALKAASSAPARIEIGHVGIYNLLMTQLHADEDEKSKIHRLIAAKNYAGLGDVLERFGDSRTAEILRKLPALFGTTDALSEAERITEGYDPALTKILDYLKRLLSELKNMGFSESVMLDFGVVNQAEYYSSLVFRGYMESTGMPVLSGGRYDDLLSDFGETLPATGFALNIDLISAATLKAQKEKTDQNAASISLDSGKVRIALTKGRLEEDFVKILETAGYDCSVVRDKGRKLLISIPGTNIELFLAKAPDVITYVEHGVCDIGIVGKDTIVEHGGTYYEILDLGIGVCKFALAVPKGTDFYEAYGSRVIASKYPNVAASYFESKGMDVDIIKIEGSVELAPLLHLADGIVDIVETGTTLRENGLEVIEDIRRISARLIVNVSSMKLKKAAIEEISRRIGEVIR
jgi:ATP phosphoribosyltransferase regulatory subunit